MTREWDALTYDRLASADDAVGRGRGRLARARRRRTRHGCGLRDRPGHGAAGGAAAPRPCRRRRRLERDGGARADTSLAVRGSRGVRGRRSLPPDPRRPPGRRRSCRPRRSTGSSITTRSSRTSRPSCDRMGSSRRNAAAPATSRRSRRRSASWVVTSRVASTSPPRTNADAAGAGRVHRRPDVAPRRAHRARSQDVEPYLATISLGDHVEGMADDETGTLRLRSGSSAPRSQDRLRPAQHPRPPRDLDHLRRLTAGHR